MRRTGLGWATLDIAGDDEAGQPPPAHPHQKDAGLHS
jgi:hypothetical protein